MWGTDGSEYSCWAVQVLPAQSVALPLPQRRLRSEGGGGGDCIRGSWFSATCVVPSVAVVSVSSVCGGALLWVHMDLYQIPCDPEMAETTQRRLIRAAYLQPMWSLDRTRSLGGYQLPKAPTMNGSTSTSA